MSFKKVFTIIIVVLALGGCVFAYFQLSKKSVEVYTVKSGDIAEYIELRGNVELSSKTKIFSKENGTVKSIYVNEGDTVSSQTRLVEMEVVALKPNGGLSNVIVKGTSDTNGTVLSKFIEIGQPIQQGMPLMEIGDYSSSYIKLDVLTDDVAKISLGQKVLISGEVLGEKNIEGVISYIAPKAESKISSLGVNQQKVEVRVKIDNNSAEVKGKLKPGYDVDAKVITTEKKSVIQVPSKSVFDMDDKKSVFVVKDNKLKLRTVQVGIKNDNEIEIITGLLKGDLIVVNPSNSLKDGESVKVK